MSRKNSMTAVGGNFAITSAIVLVTLLGFAALSIDIGYARVVQQELQNTSEAAAHAGSVRLDGTDAGITAARAAAVMVAHDNLVAGSAYTLDANTSNATDGSVVVGVWDATTRSFTPSTTAASVNAVQVRTSLDHVGLIFAPTALAQSDIPVSAEARMVAGNSGASAVNCFIPLAIADCLIDRSGLDGMQSVTLNLNPAGIDNVGWARPNGTPNASYEVSQISSCTNYGEIKVGDPIGLQSGVVTSAMNAIATRISSSTTQWSTSKWGTLPAKMSGSDISSANYGKTYEGPIIVVDAGSEYCSGSGGSWNQTLPLKGFMWGALYDVATGSGAASKTIRLRVDVRSEYKVGTRGGGPDYGIIAHSPPQMVAGD